jgi:hypothetical protein
MPHQPLSLRRGSPLTRHGRRRNGRQILLLLILCSPLVDGKPSATEAKAANLNIVARHGLWFGSPLLLLTRVAPGYLKLIICD